MSWRLLNKPKTLLVTKALADRFVQMDAAPHDRNLSERRLGVYNRLLDLGEFRPVTWAMAHCLETGGNYRVNGKHTSIMLSGRDPVPEFYVTVEEYECDTLQDVGKLYSTFDSALQSRTAIDIYISFARTVREYDDVWVKVITTTPPGIAMAMLGLDGAKKSQPVDRAEYLLEYVEFVLWLDKLLKDGPRRDPTEPRQKGAYFLRQPVLAAMFDSFHKNMKEANEFWCAVRDETAPSRDDPTRYLARFLSNTKIRSSQFGGPKTAGAREINCRCLKQWNAFREGITKADIKYYPAHPVPKAK
jgi:hypothetical protein